MPSAPLHPREFERLEALQKYRVLDTEFEKTYDELTQLAAQICEVPISLISLVDVNRQWFKSAVGIDAKETDRDIAFCSHAILKDEVFVVNNALEDERFRDNPLVTSGPEIRFYAGAPLINKHGLPLGTLCVIDTMPRDFSEAQQKALAILAKQVIHQFELRLSHRELTELVNTLEQLNVSKNNFFSMVSHDMRTPFNSILGISRLMKSGLEDFSPEEIKDSVIVIERSAKTALKLFENIMLWSRFESGGVPCQPTRFLVKEIFDELVIVMEGSLVAKKLNLIFRGNDQVHVWCDRTMLFSALQNLTSNALKFSHAESDIIIQVEQAGHLATIVVEDHGVGMSEQQLNQVFKLGEMKSCCGTAGEQGHGLGLMLCEKFIKLNNGTITVESALGTGSKFTLKIPNTAG
jgi:signal transduction histidine kinase